MSNICAFVSKLKFDTTAEYSIIEVYSVKGLSLRGNTLRLYRAKHLVLLMNWTYGDTGFFTMAKLYLYFLKMRICN